MAVTSQGARKGKKKATQRSNSNSRQHKHYLSEATEIHVRFQSSSLLYMLSTSSAKTDLNNIDHRKKTKGKALFLQRSKIMSIVPCRQRFLSLTRVHSKYVPAVGSCLCAELVGRSVWQSCKRQFYKARKNKKKKKKQPRKDKLWFRHIRVTSPLIE